MKKILVFTLMAAVLVGMLSVAALARDRRTLERELVRLHVVAASDSEHDQSVKLSVRDAVVEALAQMLDGIDDAGQAKAYIQANLAKIQAVANDALAALGETKQAVVSFMKEKFPLREYDSFTLPSGIYDSLRIVIGEGEGHNWWCVVFPKMCYSATSAQLETVTADAGFSKSLTDTVTGKRNVRFYFLDLLGKAQNLFG